MDWRVLVGRPNALDALVKLLAKPLPGLYTTTASAKPIARIVELAKRLAVASTRKRTFDMR